MWSEYSPTNDQYGNLSLGILNTQIEDKRKSYVNDENKSRRSITSVSKIDGSDRGGRVRNPMQ